MSVFKSLLVANRGEIACRIFRTARARGLGTVAVYAAADAAARHVQLADQALRLADGDGAAPYLDGERIIQLAKASGAGAVHPGYGFLAENAAFASAVAEAGLVFVGPPPEAIRVMGSKRLSKRRMVEAGVPCVPGYDADEQSLEHLLMEAKKVGLPLMIKASAGGGGRGLRKVTRADEVEAQLRVARAEAESSFGDGELILERALENARHVEIQVFADAQGNVLHLFERDCSVQRRHQKIIEEAPSPAVGPDLRARMGAAAVDAARAVGYVGAGTVEMLLDDDGSFYFMEMNTRLQVEHPVTEMVTGLDLVALQLAVAAGEPLPFAQDDLRIDGHAIEARLYAEDARAGFLPQTGRVRRLHFPDLAGVRIDHGLLPGAQVTADYDPMLAKVIAHGASRDEARAKLCRALEETVLHGVITNRGFLCDVLEHPVFAEGEARTRFVDETTWPPPEADQAQLAEAVGAASWAREGGPGWRSRGVAAESHLELDADGARRSVAVRQERSGAVEVEVEGSVRRFEAFGFDAGGEARFVHGGLTSRATVDVGVDRIELSLGRGHHTLSRRDPSAPPEGAGGAAAGAIRAPMAGKIVDVRASDGAIEEGRVVLVLEAMKMQLELEAPRGGHLLLHVQLGDQVASKQVLAEVAEAPGE